MRSGGGEGGSWPRPFPPGRWRQHRATSTEPRWTGALDLPAGNSSRLRGRLDGGLPSRDWLGASHVGSPPPQTIEWCLSLGTWPSCAVVSPSPAGEGGAGTAPLLLGSRGAQWDPRHAPTSPLAATGSKLGRCRTGLRPGPVVLSSCPRRSSGWAAVVNSPPRPGTRPFYRKIP